MMVFVCVLLQIDCWFRFGFDDCLWIWWFLAFFTFGVVCFACVCCFDLIGWFLVLLVWRLWLGGLCVCGVH